jgi:hypothetical protein
VSGVPVAQFLVDFGNKPPPDDVTEEVQAEAPGLGDAYWAERVDEAYARGLEEGKTAAEADAAARLEEHNAAAEVGLVAAREAWTQEAGPRFAAAIGEAVADMENRLAEAVERVLRPFLAQAVRDQAIRQLRAIVQDLVGNNPGLTMEISGPEDLLEAVGASLSPNVATVSFIANTATDIQIKAGSSLIETRIAAWLKDCEGQAT